ncbi:MAG: DNA-directed RNA polymerase subunit omega [Clostridia bacterium]|nr:DNA-directed RNA polymerase subunit omega [Clostridia bacterium]MBQ9848519.1 DNA-directed RNA polymerase subunit omega [Clostridia bacterium]
MMLYPTVQDLTNDKVNRYKLVIATAKCARHLIDKSNLEREEEEARRLETDRFSKDQKPAENDILLTEKPVSVAVQKLYDGEYTIVTE